MRWFELYIAIAWTIRVAMVPVILRRQLAPGASLAWLGIIFLHPYIGVTLYLFLGETRLGPHRVQRHKEIVSLFRSTARGAAERGQDDDPPPLPPGYEPMVRQAEKISGLPVLGGNELDFLTDSTHFASRLAADIDAAQSHVHLLYYIFACDQTGRTVTDALQRAAARGVTCRLLLDAVASRPFFQRRGLARQLHAAGIHVAAALPAHFIQRRLPRMDLRNHRKLAIIDDRIGYVGSHNLINPNYGGKRGAPWVDASARITGPIVSELAGVFAEDWAFETEQVLELKPPDPPTDQGGIPMQVVPTGPAQVDATYRRLLLAAVQCAKTRLTLTTPYFVPDEPTIVALSMAADRGVQVQLLLPEISDHRLTQAAGRAHFGRLLTSGVQIHLFHPGLLHAKTVTVDDSLAMLGSANLDVRSFNLNFELSLLTYAPEAACRLRQIQDAYLAHSRPLTLAQWESRNLFQRYTDSAISLLSPLL